MNPQRTRHTNTVTRFWIALPTCLVAMGLPIAASELRTPFLETGRTGTNAEQQTLELHYTDHHRNAFEVVSKMGRLRFNLNAAKIGLAEIRPGEQPGLVAPGSFSFKVTLPTGGEYESQLASSPARINLFRHGPHYIDARVFDLIPTNKKSQQLPVKGELIFHIWSRRLYVEARLHAERKFQIDSASLTLNLEQGKIDQAVLGSGEAFARASLPMRHDPRSGKNWFGFVGRGQTLAYSVPAPDGTQVLMAERTGDQIEVVQRFLLPESGSLLPDSPVSLNARLYIGSGASLDAIGREVALEATPLTACQFAVDEGATFSGYNPRTGYYTIGTARPESLRWLYEHPEVISTAQLAIHNDGPPRRIAIRHENTSPGGRLGAGIVTDVEGRALPILVQNSKNFRGEDEESFYNPGDPAYNESYFILSLRRDEYLNLQSHQTYQNWGNNPPRVTAQVGRVLNHFPARVAVDENEQARFRLEGGFGILPARVEGFASHVPPRFEIRQQGVAWEELEMGSGNRGHQVYRLGNGKFGFVLLVDTDGALRFLRTGP